FLLSFFYSDGDTWGAILDEDFVISLLEVYYVEALMFASLSPAHIFFLGMFTRILFSGTSLFLRSIVIYTCLDDMQLQEFFHGEIASIVQLRLEKYFGVFHTIHLGLCCMIEVKLSGFSGLCVGLIRLDQAWIRTWDINVISLEVTLI
ncbi:hypothetical protein ACJX0J_008954, partial [Zea mays]